MPPNTTDITAAAIGRKGILGSSRRLSAVGVVIIVATLAVAALTVWQLRADAIAAVRRDLTNISVLAADEMMRSMQAVDLIVQDVSDHLHDAHIETSGQFNNLIASQKMHDFLADDLKSLPQADALTLVGTDGEVVNSSRGWPVTPIDATDRDFYLYLRDHDDAKVYISGPVKNRATGVWTFYVARRITNARGQWLGIATAAIAVDYVEQTYKAVSLQQNGAVSIVRNDGTLLARYPHHDDKLGRNLHTPDWQAQIDQGGGMFRSHGLVDGVIRLIASRPLANYPLVVNVSVPTSVSASAWGRLFRSSARKSCIFWLAMRLLNCSEVSICASWRWSETSCTMRSTACIERIISSAARTLILVRSRRTAAMASARSCQTVSAATASVATMMTTPTAERRRLEPRIPLRPIAAAVMSVVFGGMKRCRGSLPVAVVDHDNGRVLTAR